MNQNKTDIKQFLPVNTQFSVKQTLPPILLNKVSLSNLLTSSSTVARGLTR